MAIDKRILKMGGDLSGYAPDEVQVKNISNVTSGTLSIANGGTGISTTPTNGQLLIGNGGTYDLATITAGTNMDVTNGPSSISIGLIDNIILTSVTASLSGSGANVTNLNANNISAGTLAIARGGTGLSTSPTNGQFLIGSGSTYSLGTISSGSNTTVTTGSGSITVDLKSNITVTSITASEASVSGGLSVGNFIQMLPVGAINIPTNTTASYIYTSGSTNDLYFTQYQGPFTNTTRLRWLEGTLYTGLLHGGVLSTVNGTTSFSITSGSGLIVTQNASTSSDPYPTIQLVQWGAYVSQSLEFSSSAEITYVSINSSGQISQATSPPTFAQYKDRIFLGRILHQSGSVTNGSINTPPTAYGNTSNLADFARAIGPLKISGHFLAASGSVSLALTKTAGDSYVEGRNYAFNPNLPNIVVAADDPDVTVSKIYRIHTSGSSVIIDNGVAGAGYTTLDPAQYQNGNVLAGVANNKFSVQRIYWFPRAVNRALFAYYGQAIYDNFDDAIAGISTENFTEGSNTAGSAILVAYVVLKGDSANFTSTTTTRISQAGLFRGAGVGGGGTSGGGATSLNGLSDVLYGSPTTGQALVWDGAKWVNGTPLNATSASFATTAATASYIATGSAIATFQTDVRAQFTAGTNITITNGQISSTGGSSGSGSNTTGSFSNSSTWTFNHNLSNRTPVIQVLDSNYNQIIPQNIEFTNTNTATITFPTSESGYAIASLGGTTVSASYATTASYALTSALTPSTYYVQGKLAADQSIPTGSDTLVSFVDDYDPNNWWNATSKQFTPTVSGTYSVTFAVWLEAPLATSGQVNIQARKNNNTFMLVQQPLHNNAGSGISLLGTRLIQMNGTSDYLDFTVYNGAASSKNIQATNGTWFSAHLLTM